MNATSEAAAGYRRQAAHCREQALQSANTSVKQQWTRMAKDWDGLADSVEKNQAITAKDSDA
jgi:hypothetical protein